jgi:L-iditol 2-dehydrogenase
VLLHQGIKTIVAGTSSDSHRLAIAKRLGAVRVVDVEKEDLLEIVRNETDGAGADAVFETAGAAASASACLQAVRPLGSYTQVGHFGRQIPVFLDHVAFKQLRLAGSIAYTVATWERTMRLLSQGLRGGAIITHRLTLQHWREGFDLFEQKVALKVLLTPKN